LALAGCTVQPLYAPHRSPARFSRRRLPRFHVKPVNGRVGQKLRNHLIFILNNGSGLPANPAYDLKLDVQSKAGTRPSCRSDLGRRTDCPHRHRYRLLQAVRADGTLLSRTAAAAASYDVSLQEFANTRAERDAENRAARDAAEQLRALIAADLKRAGAS
jgi:LPS-assembly lipoprotein